MSNFVTIRFIFLGTCILSILQDAMANENQCTTLKLGPKQKLMVSVFDIGEKASLKKGLWPNLCDAIKKFPKGLISMEYRPGALATGSIGNVQCGSGDCKMDTFQMCTLLHFDYLEDCYKEAEGGMSAYARTYSCYCTHSADQYLLQNGKARKGFGVPDNVLPALAFNQLYDPCAKTGSTEDIVNYFCQVYQNAVTPCKK